MAKICPKCGKENKDTAKFCEDCGTTLNEVGSKQTTEKKPKSSNGIMNFWNKQSTTGKAIIGVAGICCIGLILIIGISGLMVPDKTTSTYSSNATQQPVTTQPTNNITSSTPSTSSDTSSSSSSSASGIQVQVSYSGSWQGSYGDESGQQSVDGSGTKIFNMGSPNIVSAVFQKMDSGHGTLTVEIIENGMVVESKSTSATYGVVSVSHSFY